MDLLDFFFFSVKRINIKFGTNLTRISGCVFHLNFEIRSKEKNCVFLNIIFKTLLQNEFKYFRKIFFCRTKPPTLKLLTNI